MAAVQPDTSTFFEDLRNAQIDALKLTNFLWYCIDSGLQGTKTKRNLELSLCATNMYFALSSIKKAKTYKVFNINIFQKCVMLLKNTEKMLRPLASKVATILLPKKRGAAATTAADQERNGMDTFN